MFNFGALNTFHVAEFHQVFPDLSTLDSSEVLGPVELAFPLESFSPDLKALIMDLLC